MSPKAFSSRTARGRGSVLPFLLLALGGACTESVSENTPPPEPAVPDARLATDPAPATTAPSPLEPHGPLDATPTNIWLITVDTLRADHLGCYGYPRDTSPFLDKFAEHSLRFDQALVQWPKTGPSIASLFTSTYGSTSGVMRETSRHPIPPAYATLAEILQVEGGYECLAVVTNISLSPRLHYDQGFDRFELLLGGPKDEAQGVYRKARELIEQRERPEAPFFLWTHLIDPHSPYRTPPHYRELFVGDALYEADQRPPAPVDPEVQQGGRRDLGPQNAVGSIGRYAYLPQHGGSLREYVVEYDAEIRYGDDHLRDFTYWMRRNGHLDDTLVVFTADHGESLGDHDYYFAHGRFPYDACSRVPLIVHHPSIPPGVYSEPVALLDLAPSMLDAVGLQPGYQMEGRSILRRWMQPQLPRPDGPVFVESGYEEAFTVALRRGDHKLIKIDGSTLRAELSGEPYELYDLAEDPRETHNLVHERPELFRRMKAELDHYQQIAVARVPPSTESPGELSEREKQLLSELGYNASGRMGDEAEDRDEEPTRDDEAEGGAREDVGENDEAREGGDDS